MKTAPDIIPHRRWAIWRSFLPTGIAGMLALTAVVATLGRLHGAATNSDPTTVTNALVITNAPPSGSVAIDYSAFRMIADRNIFNAGRSSRRSARGEERQTREVKVESFSVVGTISYAKGDFAFFDGSGKEFRKPLKVGESIAGHKLVAIGIDDVQMEAGDKKLILKMGARMLREEDGPWQLMDTSPLGRDFKKASVSSSSSSDTAASESTDAGGDDALKRLLEKREKELKNENQ
ncbi:MAG: hypothetical protein EXS36_16830 [Pedosphaera sp.]|nr:hypothetical protein [Pedosphaera sp.]